MMVALWQFDKEDLLAGMLLFRLLYYIVPFVISLVILGIRELLLGRAARRIAAKETANELGRKSATPVRRRSRGVRLIIVTAAIVFAVLALTKVLAAVYALVSFAIVAAAALLALRAGDEDDRVAQPVARRRGVPTIRFAPWSPACPIR